MQEITVSRLTSLYVTDDMNMQYNGCKLSCPVFYGYIIYSSVKYSYTNGPYLMTTMGTIKVLN